MLHNGFRINDHMPTPLLVLLLQDRNQPQKKRWAACIALGSKTEPAAFDILLETLDSEDWRLRRFALEALKRHPNAFDARDEIVSRLFDVNEEVRQSACKVCGWLGLDSAHDGIRELLKAESPYVRDMALNTLDELWRDDDFDAVFRLYRDDSRRGVRIAAAKTLRRHANATTWTRLFQFWSRDREARHRLWSCELAAEFGDRTIVPSVRRMLEDRNRNVRQAASESLKALSAA